jgi:hypothetical protein
VVRQHHRAGMAHEPMGEAHLVVPAEALRTILAEGGA